jgi:hypothetical protein
MVASSCPWLDALVLMDLWWCRCLQGHHNYVTGVYGIVGSVLSLVALAALAAILLQKLDTSSWWSAK